MNSEADGSTRRMKEVKERTREAFYRAWDSRAAMEMVDTVERLGLSYHFEGEINALLQRFCDWNASEVLFTTALRFRLLRQNGFPTHSGKHSLHLHFQFFTFLCLVFVCLFSNNITENYRSYIYWREASASVNCFPSII